MYNKVHLQKPLPPPSESSRDAPNYFSSFAPFVIPDLGFFFIFYFFFFSRSPLLFPGDNDPRPRHVNRRLNLPEH